MCGVRMRIFQRPCHFVTVLAIGVYAGIPFWPMPVDADELPEPIQLMLEGHCLDCHNTDIQQGGLDVEPLLAGFEVPMVAPKLLQAVQSVTEVLAYATVLDAEMEDIMAKLDVRVLTLYHIGCHMKPL